MLLLTAALAHAEVYALADAGITLDLPSGWEMTRWSDWDFKGKTGDGAVLIEAWYTTFQVPVTKEAAESWAGLYSDKLDSMHAEGILRDTLSVEEVNGRTTARTTMRFTLDKGGPKGAMFVAAFAVEGKVMHVATLAAGANASRAQTALDTLLNRLTVQKPPAEIVALAAPIDSDLGLRITLPDGWRRPLPSEEDEAGKPLAALPIAPKDTSKCVRVIHPNANGTADLVAFCQDNWKTGILDELSFADVELTARQHFFGKAGEKVPVAEKIERTDRLGLLIAPELADNDLRIGVMPYDRGTIVAWGIGAHGSGDALTSAVRSTLTGLEFSGPEGGAAVYEVGDRISHILTYDPFHPAILATGLFGLAIFGGTAWLIFGRKKPPVVHY